MGKLSKQDLKLQQQVSDLLWSKPNLSIDETEFVYSHFDPGTISEVASKSAYFTPLDLAQDFAIFLPKYGDICDVAAGIGMLTYKAICYNYYHSNTDSITLLEYNPQYLEIAKKLINPLSAYNEDRRVIKFNFVEGDAFAKETWQNILPKKGFFDCIYSNPPYGKLASQHKDKYKDHLLYHHGEMELMTVELICRYSKHGQVIIPPISSDVQFSARPYCDRRPSRKLDGLRKALGNKYFFMFEAEGVDCGLYVDQWKGTKILTEVLSVNLNKEDYEPLDSK